MKEVEHLLPVMTKRKLMPNVLTYTSLLHGYERIGSRSEMFTLFDEMVERGIEPDGVIYSMMLDACLKKVIE